MSVISWSMEVPDPPSLWSGGTDPPLYKYTSSLVPHFSDQSYAIEDKAKAAKICHRDVLDFEASL